MKRMLWIVNHKTLLPAEAPIIQSLGYEVYIPKIVPNDTGYRSAVIDHSFDKDLTLPYEAVQVLNNHNFYEQNWSPTIRAIINKYFDSLVTSVSGYTAPLFEALHKFNGLIIARPFGREHPRTYTEFFTHCAGGPEALKRVEAIGERFVFGQCYDNLAEIEVDTLRNRARTITVPIPDTVWARQDTWTGSDHRALFLCPNIGDNVYYRGIYDQLIAQFPDTPRLIFGRQNVDPGDSTVCPYLTDEELLAVYGRAPVFPYFSMEPRHVHYSPLEAIIVGAPVLFMKGGLLNTLAGRTLPGLCKDFDEMRAKTARLLKGDAGLSEEIRASQGVILQHFSSDLARHQWAGMFKAFSEGHAHEGRAA